MVYVLSLYTVASCLLLLGAGILLLRWVRRPRPLDSPPDPARSEIDLRQAQIAQLERQFRNSPSYNPDP